MIAKVLNDYKEKISQLVCACFTVVWVMSLALPD